MSMDERMREGRRRLKKRWGQAKAMAKAKNEHFTLQSKTVVAQSMLEIVREKNLDALIVYEGKAGNWFGDLVFKGLPPGVPTIMGTPTSMPRSNFEDAERDAFQILVGILASIEEQKTTKRDRAIEDMRVFQLYNMDFNIDPASIEKARVLAADMAASGLLPKDLDEGDVKAQLDLALAPILIDGRIEEAAFKGADDRTKALMYSSMSLLLNFGVFRHPDVPTSTSHFSEVDAPTKH